MKIIAMYLPQFHRVPENDEWWGEGFTDWTAVKLAEPLFEGHKQPRVPLGDNYYDLADKTAMQHQAELMHEYGIDGLCFYHYYFENGRMILETPLENLLQWKDIDMPYCICWANESWIRSWSKIKNANNWADKFEQNMSRTGDEYLVKQEYGDEAAWTEHFNYLLQFFRDERYIKIDGKPIIWIYRTNIVDCFEDMIRLWNQLAIREGFEGLYCVGSFCDNYTSGLLDGIVEHEPVSSFFSLKNKSDKKEDEPYILDYDDVWRKILGKYKGRKTIYEGFVGFDDTPRRGLNGTCVANMNVDKFEDYLSQLLAKAEVSGSEVVFLNAWNEWAEGMYLEPDVDAKYTYLQAISSAKESFSKYTDKYKELLPLQEESYKLDLYMNFYENWMNITDFGVRFEKWLGKKGINSISIYGIGRMGRNLINIANKQGIKIDYLIDNNCVDDFDGIKVYSSASKLPETEIIIVTAFYFYKEISNALRSDNISVISLEKIIGDMEKEVLYDR